MPKKNDDFFKKKKEWSKVKDKLLGCYLTPYFSKILFTRKPTIYVDGFAGKGKFEDGEDGSPLTAIKCMQQSQSNYSGKHTKPHIEMKFIDLYHARELKENLITFQNQNYEIISGAFEKELIPMLKREAAKNRDRNLFLYIDPYGVKALNAELFDVLPDVFRSVELLINFNSWGLLRMAFSLYNEDFYEANKDIFSDLEEYDDTAELSANEVNEILGGDYWRDIVQRFRKNEIDGYDAEIELSRRYKMRLKDKYTYVLDMPIRLKSGQRPKYRMVFATNHPDGCNLMADNISNQSEMFLEVQRSGQMTLYSETVENEIILPDSIMDKMKETLRNFTDFTRLNFIQAKFFTDYGVICKSSEISSGHGSVLRKLEKQGYIDVNREPKMTKNGLPSTFWQEDKGKTIEVRIKSKYR